MMTKMVMDVTVRDEKDDELFSRQQEFSVSDLYFMGGKQVPMAAYDVTATEHFNFGLKPLESDAYTYILPLQNVTEAVDVEVKVSYIYSLDRVFIMGKEVRKIIME
jgi:hypothetical protein